ncbi:MAG: bifunctional 5,10-methylenetetrahydrofolate dehydrogenase/5,10-methenyltetrahydrofolate cyclohydrolase [Candidatus Thermoplasmatota archaeon]|nr:bifunctional 5,10-methylenetetrahydrofolate dehydrogenase/5,10-methenyltetrahydrofolate cyclohydrolase [Candidatus Thermoplasmatota archaeon]MBU1941777.1 bifunctional 5,10-methylenetetrahydrofolate dehydrogenase/5,10-methenyltetrahydrofolate cyclohydrolase [Candidatus Thermoplasmatota archaeon]
MPTLIINGKEIAHSIKKQMTTRINYFKTNHHINPNVATIKIGQDPSSDLYLKLRNKACKEVGITTTEIDFEASISQEEVVQTLIDLNHNNAIHGILIQYPVPQHIHQFQLMNTISPQKDIEGLHPHNLGQTLLGNEYLVPCTPLAVIKILEHEAIDLTGKNVTIINHSNVVGKPLAVMCLNRNATVNVCNIFTKDITPFTKKADVLIPATGIPGLITKNHIKKNSIIIDVGIAATKDGIKGDVNRTSVDNIAAKLTPVPGGVGPVTIASSIINMVQILEHNTKNQ